MSIPVTRTKILVPRRRADLLSRQRLLDLLDNLLDYKVIIVAAPAGYGKTSLLVDLAHRVELPVCWYALDSLDRDPQRFIAHFIAAIAQRFPDFGHQSAAALQTAGLTTPDVNRLVTTIVNEAYEHIREHFVLVLDDYHFVDNCPEVQHFVNQFVQNVDENCHLIFTSRTLLPLPDLPLMVARAQVGGLSFEELAFRAEEIQALILQNHHLTMPRSIAEELERETEGWITGLLLSAQTMWQGMADRLRTARVSGVGLYDYLAQQVLDQQPPAIRDFLLRTSLLEEFNAGLCQTVLGPASQSPGGWHGLIDTVLRNNLFVLPVDDEGTWVRYHHLFRDFLQARLAREQPDEAARILRRLAEVYAERREWEKAHDLYDRLGDVEATADLIERAGSSMVQNGRLLVLGQWLDALPGEVLASHAGLLSLRGTVAMVQGEVARAVSLLNQAETTLRASRDWPRLARTLVRRAVAHRFLGDYQASLRDADEALALAERDSRLRSVQAEALRAKGLSLYQNGRLGDSVEWLERSLAVYRLLDETQNIAMLLMELGTASMSAGRYNQALDYYHQALDQWQRTENVAWQANLFNNLGVLYHLKGDYEQAASCLEKALVYGKQSGYARTEAAALAGVGDLYADLDALDAALEAYRQAREIARRIDDRFLLLYLDLSEALLVHLKGETEEAYDLLESARQRARAGGSRYEQALYLLAAGRFALHEGQALEAIARLKDAAECFDSGGQRVEAARTRVYLAAGQQASGDERAALSALEGAFIIASALESSHTLLVAARGARRLLEVARRSPALRRQASQLLKLIDRFESEIPALRRRLRGKTVAVPVAAPRLAIQALGRAQVTVDGRLVTSSDWQTQAARDLFFCLLAHPDGLTKEAVGALFWPDDSEAQVKLKFKNTMYRLRHALEQEVVIFDGERYHFNKELDYESDVELFLSRLAQARAATNDRQRAQAYEAAVRLYKGHYLPEIDAEWAWMERERLARACVEANLKLAELHLEAGEYRLTLDDCQRLLAEDPCLEEAHRLAMRAHAAMGNRAAVARQFERCRQALLQEVSVPPSQQTEELYKTLVR